jgi:hypothetical protein
LQPLSLSLWSTHFPFLLFLPSNHSSAPLVFFHPHTCAADPQGGGREEAKEKEEEGVEGEEVEVEEKREGGEEQEEEEKREGGEEQEEEEKREGGEKKKKKKKERW